MRRQGTTRWICMAALALPGAFAHGALPIYDATQIGAGSYRIVKRLWAESWRTAFDVPRDATRDDALQRLLRAAEEAGADAVVNVYCVGQQRWPRGYYCYGNAVRLNAK